jgi:hypothetical protein
LRYHAHASICFICCHLFFHFQSLLMFTLLVFRQNRRLINCCIWINKRYLIEAKVGEL